MTSGSFSPSFSESFDRYTISGVDHYRFYRISGRLVLSPVGRSIHHSVDTSEGYEAVSDVFRVDTFPDATASYNNAMTAVSSAWAANSGASVATLKAALHAALRDNGFIGQGGIQLP